MENIIDRFSISSLPRSSTPSLKFGMLELCYRIQGPRGVVSQVCIIPSKSRSISHYAETSNAFSLHVFESPLLCKIHCWCISCNALKKKKPESPHFLRSAVKD
jgi:hypothetical protein